MFTIKKPENTDEMEELGSCNTQNDIWAAKSLQSSIIVEEF